MKLHDAVSGLLILIVGIAVTAEAAGFPPMPGQSIGPALFPSILGIGLCIAGMVLLVIGARHHTGPFLELEEWVRRPRMVLNLVVVLGALVFYVLAVDTLGFFLTAILFLSVLLAAFGVARRLILPIAALAAFAIHYGFYTLLRVPLPWGLLEAIAW
jgi:putative tricarboxylic transport membrane protein